MADDEKNIEETTEDAPEVEAVKPVAETQAPVPGTDESVPGTDSAPEADAATPESDEQVPDPEGSGTAAPAKKQRSQRHVPRSARRTRSKTTREKPATRKPITRLPKPDSELGRRQERRGVVVSDKGDKTIVVKVDVIKSHAKYKKVIRRAVKFHAHDEANTAGVGDTVRIVETRPLSKTKRWRLAEIVEKAR